MQANQGSLVRNWQRLIRELSEDQFTRARLLVAPFNELDKFYIQWQDNSTTGQLGQASLYLQIFDALFEVNPYMLFLVQASAAVSLCHIKTL